MEFNPGKCEILLFGRCDNAINGTINGKIIMGLEDRSLTGWQESYVW